MKTVYSVCGMCGTRCPVAVGVENGEAVWIQGNPHSATGSTLCPRGIAALALEKDSERRIQPTCKTRGSSLKLDRISASNIQTPAPNPSRLNSRVV